MKRKVEREIAERLNPGDREPINGSPGSIEQQLDMVEGDGPRGDEILHSHGIKAHTSRSGKNLRTLDEIMMNSNFNEDMSEEDREGDEMSGDDHSSGLQGGEAEIEGQDDFDSGIPGDRTRRFESIQKKRNIA